MVSANWKFDGDPCPIQKYEWSVYGVDGSVARAAQHMSAGRDQERTEVAAM